MGRRYSLSLMRRVTGETSAMSSGGPRTPGLWAGRRTPGLWRAGRRKCFLLASVTPRDQGAGAGCCSVALSRNKGRSLHCCGSLKHKTHFRCSSSDQMSILPLDKFWKVPYSDNCLLKFLCLCSLPWLAARMLRCQSDNPSGLLRSNLQSNCRDSGDLLSVL